MISSVASFGHLSPLQGPMARAAAPVADAPSLGALPTPQAQPTPSAVALAPVAMSALIEAQAQLNAPAPVLDRQDTAAKIDRLVVRMAGTATPMDATFDVRRLQQARAALVHGSLTLHA